MARNLETQIQRAMICLDGLMPRRKQVGLIKGISSTHQIESFWRKYPDHNEGAVNGLAVSDAVAFAPGCPYLYTEFKGGFHLSLWVDIEEMCSPKIPQVIRQSISDMADFQCWVHQIERERIRDHICQIIANAL